MAKSQSFILSTFARTSSQVRRWVMRAAITTRVLTYPGLAISLTATVGGEAIFSYLKARRRLPTLVLDLPASPATYLRGRHRQAVRTNMTKALKLGITVGPVSATEARTLARSASQNGTDISALAEYASHPHRAGMIEWVGRDAQSSPIAFARAQVDGTVALLEVMVAIRNDERSVVRYMLSGCLFQHLAAGGLRHIIVYGDNEPTGHRYFAARLGFSYRIIRAVRSV